MQRREILIAAAAAATLTIAPGAGHAQQTPGAAPEPYMLVLWRDGQQGKRLEVRGRVLDAAHKPLRDAQVSVRHSGPDGDYTGEYEGGMVTNARGEYILRTAMPGGYGRPLHIHVNASHPSAGYAFTEIVFRGDRMLDQEHQPNGIVLETVRLNDIEVLVGNFDIVLGK